MPIRRLIIITLITVIWTVLAVIGLRKVGLSDQFQSFEHPMLGKEYWLIAWHPSMSRAEYKKSAALNPKIILGAAVQSLKDGELVLSEKHYIAFQDEVSFLRGMKLEEWRKLNPDGLTLKEFISEFSDRRIYLNVDRLNILNGSQLYESLAPLKDSKNVLIKSSPQGIKRSLKDKQPLWLFSNTTAEIGKLKLMQALFLEPIASIDADFFVDKYYNPRLLQELRRRHKKAIYKPKKDDPEVLIKARSYDGLVTAQPSDFISLVD